MDGNTYDPDADREFDELSARAYGPNPDIDDDPPALARLRELEAGHRAGVERRADAPTSASANASASARAPATGPAPAPVAAPGRAPVPGPTAAHAGRPAEQGPARTLWQRATATWWSRLAWAMGALLVVGGILAAVLVATAPRPDATLRPTATGSDERLRSLVAEETSMLQIDPATLRAYGSYRGLEIWSATNTFDSPCLVAMYRANDTLSEWRCAPPEADLIMDVASSGDGFGGFDGLDGVGIIRFIYHGDTVDAFVHLLPEAGG